MSRSSASEAILETVDSLYAASVDPHQWSGALRSMTHLLGGEGANLHIGDVSKGGPPLVLDYNIENDREYIDHYAKIDPRIAALQKNPQAKVWFDYCHIEENEIRKSEYYDWTTRKHGVKYYAALVSNWGANGNFIVGVQRTPRQGHVDEATIKTAKLLHGHFERAALIAQRIGTLNNRTIATSVALDRLSHGVIFLDSKGKPVFRNRCADHLLLENDGLLLDADGLQCSYPPDDRHLQKLLKQALEGSDVRTMGGSFAVRRPSRRQSYTILINPIDHRNDLPIPEQAALMVVITDPGSEAKLSEEKLQAVFGLSPAEAAVAASLVRGLSLAQIAEVSEVTRNTVKSQLRSIFMKTGTNRQAELIKTLLVSIAGVDDAEA